MEPYVSLTTVAWGCASSGYAACLLGKRVIYINNADGIAFDASCDSNEAGLIMSAEYSRDIGGER